MQRSPHPAPTTSQAPDRTNGVVYPAGAIPRALKALARLLARQEAREFLASPPLENGEPADDEA